jgi:hypothetical protein
VTCDNDGTVPSCNGGWEEGAMHFESEQEAIEVSRTYGFVVVGGSVLCSGCASSRDCARLGHQWDEWTDGEHLGVTFRRRYCDHCNTSEHSQEFQQVVLLAEVRDIVDRAERAGSDG